MNDQITVEISDAKITGKPETVDRIRYFAAVGAFTVAWSTLEYLFDLCIAIIYERAPDGKSLARKIPTALSDKMALFRKAHYKIDELKAHAEEAEKIAEFMKEVGDIRHMIAHSVAVKSEVLGESHLRRIVRSKSGLREARGNISTNDIATLTRAVTKKFKPLIAYCNFLAETFPDHSD
jgi:hypothetical protein